MKFSNYAASAQGTRAERAVEFPVQGGTFKLLVRPLDGVEESIVLQRAAAHARERGSTDPKIGDPLYDLGLMVHTVALGCLDPDSPPEKRELSFDGGADQVLAKLTRDDIAFLHEQQQLWQDECSPYVSRMSAGELIAAAVSLAEGDHDLPFVRLRPALRLSLLRTLANLWLGSRGDKSPSGGPGEASSAASSETH